MNGEIIENNSLIGEINTPIELYGSFGVATAWGDICGDIAKQQDLDTALKNIENKIPKAITKTSQLENDAGFLIEHQSLSDYAKKDEMPTIPTNISSFVNDKGYLTEHQDLSEYPKITGFKTINNESVLGEGNINIQGGDGKNNVYVIDFTNNKWAANNEEYCLQMLKEYIENKTVTAYVKKNRPLYSLSKIDVQQGADNKQNYYFYFDSDNTLTTVETAYEQISYRRYVLCFTRIDRTLLNDDYKNYKVSSQTTETVFKSYKPTIKSGVTKEELEGEGIGEIADVKTVQNTYSIIKDYVDTQMGDINTVLATLTNVGGE